MLRSCFTAIGVAVAVGSFIALIGLSRGVEKAWIDGISERGTHIMAFQKGTIELLAASIDENIRNDLIKVDGISNVASELVALVSLDYETPVLITGWSYQGDLWDTLRIKEGFGPETNHQLEVLIGISLAVSLNKSVGDKLNIQGNDFEIIGITENAGVLNNQSLIMSLKVMQKLLDRAGKVTQFHLRIDKPSDSLSVKKLLSRLALEYPELSFFETAEIAENNKILKLFRGIAWSTSIVALLISVVVILNTLLMSVTERTREIGILSAIGWKKSRTISMIVIEGVMLSFIGSAFGVVIGMFGLNWLSSASPLSGFISTDLNIYFILELLVAVFTLGVVSSIYPAYRATSLNPVDALKYE